MMLRHHRQRSCAYAMLITVALCATLVAGDGTEPAPPALALHSLDDAAEPRELPAHLGDAPSLLSQGTGDVTLIALLDAQRQGPMVVAPLSEGTVGMPNPLVPAAHRGKECLSCAMGSCSHAYFHARGKYCGQWMDDGVKRTACCPANFHCLVDRSKYVGCVAAAAPSALMSALHATTADSVVGTLPWILVWYIGGLAAAGMVATCWFCTHPTVKAVRGIPELPERDAIVSFPLRRSVHYTTRVAFATVLLSVIALECLCALALTPSFVWGTAPRQLRFVVIVGAVTLLVMDWDTLLARRFIVSGSLLEVSRRLRPPLAIRLSQVIGVKRVQVNNHPALLLRTPLHYSTSYSDIVEVTYARDGCGSCGCRRPGVGTLLLSPQHVSHFMVLLRQRSAVCKRQADDAAAVVLDGIAAARANGAAGAAGGGTMGQGDGLDSHSDDDGRYQHDQQQQRPQQRRRGRRTSGRSASRRSSSQSARLLRGSSGDSGSDSGGTTSSSWSDRDAVARRRSGRRSNRRSRRAGGGGGSSASRRARAVEMVETVQGGGSHKQHQSPLPSAPPPPHTSAKVDVLV